MRYAVLLMSESNPYYPGDGGKEKDGDDSADGTRSEQVQHRAVGARVPEGVGRGVFSTGAIVMSGQAEFVLDFVQRMGRPHQVAARIVLPHSVLPRFISALEENLKRFEDRFGPPPKLPKPDPDARRPSIQEIYDDLKMPDDVLSGSYCNSVMIGHSASDFSFDFITNFFPQSAVSRRVFLSAAQVVPMLDSLKNTWKQFQQRVVDQQKQQHKPLERSEPEHLTQPPPEPPKDESGDSEI
ncbi:MAG: DUF3467 domain-containing protein [Phycisphaeraceae bacterium]